MHGHAAQWGPGMNTSLTQNYKEGGGALYESSVQDIQSYSMYYREVTP